MDDIVKLPKFSAMESDLLNNAIIQKKLQICELKKCLPCRKDRVYLSYKDTLKMKQHFAKKLAFYNEQDKYKWLHWPKKSIPKFNNAIKDNKLRNFKRKYHLFLDQKYGKF